MKKHYSWALTVVCVCLGTMIGVQFNTVKKQSTGTENQRLTELTATLKKVQEENIALTARLKEKEDMIATFEQGQNDTVTLTNLEGEIEKLRAFAGLTPLAGAGLVITMNDSSTKKDGDRNAYLVHAEDILSVVNELNVAGAQGVSINGQRMVGQSGVSCAGSIVMINGVRVAAPFEISAVGEGEVLQSALKFPGGVVDNLLPWGIEITMKQEPMVKLPAYTQSVLYGGETKEKEVPVG